MRGALVREVIGMALLAVGMLAVLAGLVILVAEQRWLPVVLFAVGVAATLVARTLSRWDPDVAEMRRAERERRRQLDEGGPDAVIRSR